MEYSKGDWEVGSGNGLTGPTTENASGAVCGGEDWPVAPVSVGITTIALCPDQENGDTIKPIKGTGEANAHLIAAAVNACIKLNPDNPIAAAESIGAVYEALKTLLGAYDFDNGKFEYIHANRISEAQEALAKAEESELQGR
ncbi:hypothetical protein LCGC14_2438630 [marine sediment metagenome]|uniref:Uncharacterized protein n=1 Tax=marine sediment metagenome TaxID=412755 RepID=A0A0F9DWM1_9ZZZZ